MGAFGPLDTMELFASLPPRAPQAEAKDRSARAEAGGRRGASGKRWWFTFDGWRSAAPDQEYVLA